MDNFGVPRRDALPDPGTSLEDDSGETAKGQGVTAGEADGPRSDHHGVKVESGHA